MYVVINMDRADQLPATLEPLWLDFNGSIEMYPVMTAEDFQNAAPDLERIVAERIK